MTITDRGRPVARMTPIAGSPLQALIDAGHARPATRTLRDLPPPAPGPSLSDELERMRADERY